MDLRGHVFVGDLTVHVHLECSRHIGAFGRLWVVWRARNSGYQERINNGHMKPISSGYVSDLDNVDSIGHSVMMYVEYATRVVYSLLIYF